MFMMLLSSEVAEKSCSSAVARRTVLALLFRCQQRRFSAAFPLQQRTKLARAQLHEFYERPTVLPMALSSTSITTSSTPTAAHRYFVAVLRLVGAANWPPAWKRQNEFVVEYRRRLLTDLQMPHALQFDDGAGAVRRSSERWADEDEAALVRRRRREDEAALRISLVRGDEQHHLHDDGVASGAVVGTGDEQPFFPQRPARWTLSEVLDAWLGFANLNLLDRELVTKLYHQVFSISPACTTSTCSSEKAEAKAARCRGRGARRGRLSEDAEAWDRRAGLRSADHTVDSYLESGPTTRRSPRMSKRNNYNHADEEEDHAGEEHGGDASIRPKNSASTTAKNMDGGSTISKTATPSVAAQRQHALVNYFSDQQLLTFAALLNFAHKDAFPKKRHAELRSVVLKQILRKERREKLARKGLFVDALVKLGEMFCFYSTASTNSCISSSTGLNLRTRNLITETLLCPETDVLLKNANNSSQSELCEFHAAGRRRFPLACAVCGLHDEQLFEMWWQHVAGAGAGAHASTFFFLQSESDVRELLHGLSRWRVGAVGLQQSALSIFAHRLKDISTLYYGLMEMPPPMSPSLAATSSCHAASGAGVSGSSEEGGRTSRSKRVLGMMEKTEDLEQLDEFFFAADEHAGGAPEGTGNVEEADHNWFSGEERLGPAPTIALDSPAQRPMPREKGIDSDSEQDSGGRRIGDALCDWVRALSRDGSKTQLQRHETPVLEAKLLAECRTHLPSLTMRQLLLLANALSYPAWQVSARHPTRSGTDTSSSGDEDDSSVAAFTAGSGTTGSAAEPAVDGTSRALSALSAALAKRLEAALASHSGQELRRTSDLLLVFRFGWVLFAEDDALLRALLARLEQVLEMELENELTHEQHERISDGQLEKLAISASRWVLKREQNKRPAAAPVPPAVVVDDNEMEDVDSRLYRFLSACLQRLEKTNERRRADQDDTSLPDSEPGVLLGDEVSFAAVVDHAESPSGRPSGNKGGRNRSGLLPILAAVLHTQDIRTALAKLPHFGRFVRTQLLENLVEDLCFLDTRCFLLYVRGWVLFDRPSKQQLPNKSPTANMSSCKEVAIAEELLRRGRGRGGASKGRGNGGGYGCNQHQWIDALFAWFQRVVVDHAGHENQELEELDVSVARRNLTKLGKTLETKLLDLDVNNNIRGSARGYRDGMGTSAEQQDEGEVGAHVENHLLDSVQDGLFWLERHQ